MKQCAAVSTCCGPMIDAVQQNLLLPPPQMPASRAKSATNHGHLLFDFTGLPCHWLRNTCQWNTPNIGQRYCFRKPHSQCLAPFCLIDKRLTHTCIAAFQGCVERITPVTCDGVRLLYNHRCQWYPAGATPQNPFFPICGTPYKDQRQNNRMQMLL
ncbi:hypothetical protein niasHT_037181 [Heterodera trifolii]|uniref:Uncharacterized protein n=1 Tax=Heterodera trifolii TaxID=157864 RepID=A0ABD2HWK4_9BILA